MPSDYLILCHKILQKILNEHLGQLSISDPGCLFKSRKGRSAEVTYQRGLSAGSTGSAQVRERGGGLARPAEPPASAEDPKKTALALKRINCQVASNTAKKSNLSLAWLPYPTKATAYIYSQMAKEGSG